MLENQAKVPDVSPVLFERQNRMRAVSLGRTGLSVSRLALGTAWIGPEGLHPSPGDGAELLYQEKP